MLPGETVCLNIMHAYVHLADSAEEQEVKMREEGMQLPANGTSQ